MSDQARKNMDVLKPPDNLKPARGIIRGLGISLGLWALALAAAAFWI